MLPFGDPPLVSYPSLLGSPCAPSLCCHLETPPVPYPSLWGPPTAVSPCCPLGTTPSPVSYPSLWGLPSTPSPHCPWGLPPGLLWGRGARQQRVTLGGAARLPAPGRKGGEEGTERSLRRSPRRRRAAAAVKQRREPPPPRSGTAARSSLWAKGGIEEAASKGGHPLPFPRLTFSPA